MNLHVYTRISISRTEKDDRQNSPLQILRLTACRGYPQPVPWDCYVTPKKKRNKKNILPPWSGHIARAQRRCVKNQRIAVRIIEWLAAQWMRSTDRMCFLACSLLSDAHRDFPYVMVQPWTPSGRFGDYVQWTPSSFREVRQEEIDR